LTRNKDGEMYRTNGIIHTIKDGIVINNARLMEEVAKMVSKSKAGVEVDVVSEPFTVKYKRESCALPSHSFRANLIIYFILV